MSHVGLSKLKQFEWDDMNLVILQVKIMKGSIEVTDWQTVLMEGEMFASIGDLHLSSYQEYQILVKVTNLAGLTSDAISQSFFVETEKPINIGN